MKRFKIGDWVTFSKGTSDEETFKVEWVSADGYDVGTIKKDEPNIGCITSYTRDVQFWKPDGDKFCWFIYNGTTELGKLDKYMPDDYEGLYYRYLNTNNESSYASIAEPFIGELPSNLKDNM